MNYATVGELIFFLSSPECGKNWILNESLYFHCHWNRNKLIKSRFWLRSRFLLTVHRSLKNRFGPKKLHEYCYTYYLRLLSVASKDKTEGSQHLRNHGVMFFPLQTSEISELVFELKNEVLF